jgi:cytidylate kinase
MSLVTLSATYGAGGSEVGPALAQRLGVPFVDRLIPSEVAARLAVPLDAALAHDEVSGGVLARLLIILAPIGQAFGAEAPATETVADRNFREMTEQVIFERADSGQGVILGRAGAVVLRDDPRALHVRLDGPREARLRQAMRLQGIERPTAERRMGETDRARHAYVHHFLRADARNPALYHLLINSTVIDLAVCVETIALAAEGRARHVAREAR